MSKETNITEKEYRYIYNYAQANHYITECGVYPILIDKHRTTHNLFFVFNKDSDTDRAYQSWMNNKYDTKPMNT